MRLIDADEIPYCNYDLDNYHSFRAVEDDVIAEMPTIDAVPVVRCWECKHYIEGQTVSACRHEKGMVEVTPDDFCSYGQRKENNND